MERKFTPGPWETSGSWKQGDDTSKLLALCSYHYCYNESGQYKASNLTQICELKAANMLFPVQIEANAKLIASAPELFEALESLVEAFELMIDRHVDYSFYIAAKAALNKATL